MVNFERSVFEQRDTARGVAGRGKRLFPISGRKSSGDRADRSIQP